MKKVIVLSDTHRNREVLQRLFPIMQESDYVIHLGDHVQDMQPFSAELGDKLIRVRGNCDFSCNVPEDLFVEIDGVKLFLTHGHRYRVKSTLLNVGFEALAFDCKAALYGHTHLADITEYEGVKLINPGCLTQNIMGKMSYCYMLIYGGKIYPRIVEIDG